MSERVDKEFREIVYFYVSRIPKGRVMTYGQLAALAGHPYAARIVGGIAHWGDPGLPWQRVVKKDGSLAAGYPGGVAGHQEALEAEGVEFNHDHKLDIDKLSWIPPSPGQNSLL